MIVDFVAKLTKSLRDNPSFEEFYLGNNVLRRLYQKDDFEMKMRTDFGKYPTYESETKERSILPILDQQKWQPLDLVSDTLYRTEIKDRKFTAQYDHFSYKNVLFAYASENRPPFKSDATIHFSEYELKVSEGLD